MNLDVKGPRGKYRTRQYDELVEYLKTTSGRHTTVAEICRYFAECGRSIGTATVYRHMERMVAEGCVTKYMIDESTGACYEYLDQESRCHHPQCYHCKCERCGKLIHIDCHEMEQWRRHMTEHHGFYLNPSRTVFYGICGECAAEEGSVSDENKQAEQLDEQYK